MSPKVHFNLTSTQTARQTNKQTHFDFNNNSKWFFTAHFTHNFNHINTPIGSVDFKTLHMSLETFLFTITIE